jgi:hypothetical protein
MDTFPRFVRSKNIETVIAKYLKDTNVCAYRETIDFPYDDKSFREYWVSDQDINFLRILAKDNFDWELMGSVTEDKNNLNTFFTFRNVSFNLIQSICPTFHICKMRQLESLN